MEQHRFHVGESWTVENINPVTQLQLGLKINLDMAESDNGINYSLKIHPPKNRISTEIKVHWCQSWQIRPIFIKVVNQLALTRD